MIIYNALPAPQPRGWICPVCGRGVAPTQATCPCVPVGSITVTAPPGPYQPHPTRPGIPWRTVEPWWGDPPGSTGTLAIKDYGTYTLLYADNTAAKG